MDEALSEAILILSLIAIGSIIAIYYNTIMNNNSELAKEYTLIYIKDTMLRAIKEAYRRAMVSGSLGYGYNGTVTLLFNKPIHISAAKDCLWISHLGKIENITLNDLSNLLGGGIVKLVLINRTLGSEVSFIHASKIVFNVQVFIDNNTIDISILEE